MPKPAAGESKKEYIGRCIPILVKEGKPQDQAIAICYSMWKQSNEENLIEKYLGESDIEKVKKELAFLKKSEKMKKITLAGKKRKEKLENYLFAKGIFDI